MRLCHSITTALLLCWSALLCASQEPLNESSSPLTAIGPRRLFSRTNGEVNTVPSYSRPRKGVVQKAWENRGTNLNRGDTSTVDRVWAFPIGNNRQVPAVIKRVSTRRWREQEWVKLELVYLATVGQLLAHRKDAHWHYIVMPDLGMSWDKARNAGMRLKCEMEGEKKGDEKCVKEALKVWANKVAAAYEKQVGIKNLDVSPKHLVFRHTPSNKWAAHLINWEYAQFVSQPQVPKEQHFSPDCQVDGHRPRDEQCVYWAFKENRGKRVRRDLKMYYLKKDFLDSPAIVRRIMGRTIQDRRTVHHEAMGQVAIGQYLALASKPCQSGSDADSDSDGPECMDYYLVTKNMGVPADDLKPQLSTSLRELLRQKARDRYRQKFDLIYLDDREDNYVYRLEEGSKTEFEANIIDDWAFALPVGHANPGKPET